MVNPIISKVQFDLLFNGEDLAFFLKKVADDYQYLFLNERAERFFNDAVAGKMISEILSGDSLNKIIYYFERALNAQMQVDYIDYMYYLSELRKFEMTVRPIFYENETYFLMMMKEAVHEKCIEENFMFMRAIFKNTFFSTAVLSKEGYILEVNAKFAEEFNLSVEELEGELFCRLPFMNQTNEHDFKQFLNQMTFGDSVSTSYSFSLAHQPGQSTFLITLTPIMQDSNIVAIFMLLQNITAHIEQQKELKLASHGYENIKEVLNLVADISILNLEGQIIDVNDQFLKSCRYERDEVIGKPYYWLSSRHHDAAFFGEIWDTVLMGQIWRGEVCYQSKYGENYWVDAKIIPMKDEDGLVESFVMVHNDISDKKTMMTELINIERTFRAITDNTNDFIVIFNEDGIILYTSPSYSKLLGYPSVELTGHFYEDIIAEDSKAIWRSIFENQAATFEHGDVQLDLEIKTKDGHLLWTECLISSVQVQEQWNRAQYVMVSREITQRKEHERELEFLAFHDSLTQLPNRRYLINIFLELVHNASQLGQSMAVLFIDGDDFKDINDSFGHDVGDVFIREFGAALSKSVRSGDIVVRIGGDEFIVVLTGLSVVVEKRTQQITQIIERIKNNLHVGWFIDGNHFAPTSSMGIACFPENGQTLDDLLDMADIALYEAKKLGKNSFAFAPLFSESE